MPSEIDKLHWALRAHARGSAHFPHRLLQASGHHPQNGLQELLSSPHQRRPYREVPGQNEKAGGEVYGKTSLLQENLKGNHEDKGLSSLWVPQPSGSKNSKSGWQNINPQPSNVFFCL